MKTKGLTTCALLVTVASQLLLLWTGRCSAGTQGRVANLLNKTRSRIETTIRRQIDPVETVERVCTDVLEGQVAANTGFAFDCDCAPLPVNDTIGMSFVCLQQGFQLQEFQGDATVKGEVKFDYKNKTVSYFDLELCIVGNVVFFGGSLPADGCVTANVKKNEAGNKYISACGGEISLVGLADGFTCGCSLCEGDNAIGINYNCTTPLLPIPFEVPLCFSL